jgi:cytochrome c biogenesis protein CcmG, thiol:disulfide interchange protein DsbE
MKRIIPMFIGGVLGVAVTIGLLYFMLDRVIGLLPEPTSISTETAPTETVPQVVAIINGEAITREMVDAEIKVSRFNLVDPMPPLTGDDLARATEEAVNQLVTRHLILQAAAGQNFTLTDADVDSRVDLLFGSYGAETLDQALAQANITRDDLAWWVREIFTVEEFTTQVVMANAPAEQRQQVYNNWLNNQRAGANMQTFLNGQPQSPQALMGQTAPNFTLAALDGQPVSLADFSGKVVLVNFWATWCTSCITEMPDYEQVYQRYGPDNFVVLGVNFQESPDKVGQYADGLGLTFPVLLDADGNVTTRQYQVIGMPASIIIDPQGNIFYRHLGPMSAETLQTKLAELGL